MEESSHILRYIVHYGLHLLFPGLVAWLFFRSNWKRAWLIMVATMLVDLDHLLADPVFDAGRCSIGFHPLHSGYAITGYAVMSLWPKLRIIATGLLLHMLADYTDCLWMGCMMPF
ncbi:MAG TPA: DUF6122 family protein [Bacteroidales bacterium]|nr:DUF6122 family protein [Bacteroidales bacterium]